MYEVRFTVAYSWARRHTPEELDNLLVDNGVDLEQPYRIEGTDDVSVTYIQEKRDERQH